MSLFVPSGSHAQYEPRAQPSLPPSPTEEDLGGASPWIDAEDSDDQNGTQMFNTAKRKGKTREVILDDAESEGTMTPTIEAGYPPTTEEEDESRKIQENLKRWEQLDRQRRKATRDSAASTVSNNAVSDVSRRASLLWPNRLGGGGRNAPNGTHIHTALRQTSEDALPLSDLGGGSSSPGVYKPASPASSSRTSLPSPPSFATAFSVAHTRENPFDPPDSANQLYNTSTPAEKDADAIMQPSSPPSPITCSPEESPFKDPEVVPDKPTLQATASSSTRLSPPKIAPPRILTPGRIISSPPLVAAPTRNFSESDLERPEEPESRWWTDWLCGCRESRSGDEQAGRTNPFE